MGSPALAQHLNLLILVVCMVIGTHASAGVEGDLAPISSTNPPLIRVHVVAPEALSISAPGASIDGEAMVAGYRVLRADPVPNLLNGIYVWNGAATPMTRALDADASSEFIPSSPIIIGMGTEHQGEIWVFMNTTQPLLGTTALTYALLRGSGSGSVANAVTFDPGSGLIENAGDRLPYPEILSITPAQGSCQDDRHTMVLKAGTEVRGWWCPDGPGSNPLEFAGRPAVNQLIDSVGGARTLTGTNPDGTLTFSGGSGVTCVIGGTAPNITMTCSLSSPEGTLCALAADVDAGDDDQLFFSFFQAVTITSIWCNYQGAAPSTGAIFHLKDGVGNVMTHSDPVCTDADTIPTAQPVTAANTLTAREALRYFVTNTPNPVTDVYLLCVSVIKN